jgi:hypothetical protein
MVPLHLRMRDRCNEMIGRRPPRAVQQLGILGKGTEMTPTMGQRLFKDAATNKAAV